MNTSNIISTPNIEGNIGSCATSIQTVFGSNYGFIVEIKQIATNACSGAVTIYPSWELTKGGSMFIGFSFLFFFVAYILYKKDDF